MPKLISSLVDTNNPISPAEARFRMVRDFCGLAFIAAALIYAVFLVIDNERLRELEAQKRRGIEQISAMRTSIEHRIQANSLVLNALKPEILWQDTPDRIRLQRVLDEFLTAELDISHLALAPDLKVSFVYPVEDNQRVLGLDYRTISSQYHEVLLAIASQDIVLSGPVDLVQGGTALIARLPIFQEEGALWGIASLVIDHEKLFREVDFYGNPDYLYYLYRENGEPSGKPIIGEPSVLKDDPIQVDVNVPNDTWKLAIAPRDGFWIKQQQDYWLHWLVGLSLTTLIVWAFSTLIMTQHRLRKAVYTISYQSRFDPLTDLPNRYYFMAQLQQEIKDAVEHGYAFAIIMFDLDHLRDINDALGHETGDALIEHVVERLQNSLGSHDLLARIGGDEFVVVAFDIESLSDVEKQARALINDIMNTADIAQNHINITASAGIAHYPRDAADAEHLVKCAELALYAAKASGSMSVAFYDERLRRSTEQHISLHHEMINALDAQHFHVEYQPVIETETGLLTRCEALIRWEHPERGIISPADFIPIAEKTGAIIWIGEFVMRQVIQDWQVMRDRGIDVTVAVNRSPREFNDKNAATHWLQALDDANMPPDRLMLEITESMLMRNKDGQLANLKQLREAGVHLAIDDFGTGYSSLNYLRSYPIDVIKIDRGFLKNVPENNTQTALVEVLIRIAHTLDMKVVAEGVEHPQQADFLLAEGCHYQQGFYYGRSMKLDHFIKFTKRHNAEVEALRA